MTRTFWLWSVSLLAPFAGACSLTAEGYAPELVTSDAAPTCTTECVPAAPDEVSPAAGSGELDPPEYDPTPPAAAEGARSFPIVGEPAAPQEGTERIAETADTPAAAGTAARGPEEEGSSDLADLAGRPDPISLTGFAALPGPTGAVTTGGGSAAPVLARTAAELQDLASRPEPLVIAVATTLDVGRLDVTSNKTLFGTGPDAVLLGGLAIRGRPESFVENVILANLTVRAQTSDVEGDGVQLEYAHHVWIDHCEITDAADGLLDIVHASDFVTVSNTRFAYTEAAPDPEHRFATLTGHSIDNVEEDRGRLNVTWHHNLWAADVSLGLLARFGRAHLFNNHFLSPGNEAVLRAGREARLLLENNVFEAVNDPHAVLIASGAISASGNAYLDTTGRADEAGGAFDLEYEYALDPTDAVPGLVDAGAGPR